MKSKYVKVILGASLFSLLVCGAVSEELDGFQKSSGKGSSFPTSGISSYVSSASSEDSSLSGVSAMLSETVAAGNAASQDADGSSGAASEDSSSEKETGGKDASSYGYTNLGIVVCNDAVNVRESATTDSKMVGKMTNGAACEIVSTEGDWYQITSGDVSGYISSQYVKTGDEALSIAAKENTSYGTASSSDVRIRSGASTDAEIIGMLTNGERVSVLSRDGDWIRISANGTEGYVSADYVNLQEGLPVAMTASEALYGAGVSDVRSDLVNNALQYVGNRYVWGGTSLTHGADCSGFTMAIYAQYGIYLPHFAASQANYGKTVSIAEAKPGDLVFFGRGYIHHVGIYLGNGLMVNALNKRAGIVVSSIYTMPVAKIKNVLD